MNADFELMCLPCWRSPGGEANRSDGPVRTGCLPPPRVMVDLPGRSTCHTSPHIARTVVCTSLDRGIPRRCCDSSDGLGSRRRRQHVLRLPFPRLVRESVAGSAPAVWGAASAAARGRPGRSTRCCRAGGRRIPSSVSTAVIPGSHPSSLRRYDRPRDGAAGGRPQRERRRRCAASPAEISPLPALTSRRGRCARAALACYGCAAGERGLSGRQKRVVGLDAACVGTLAVGDAPALEARSRGRVRRVDLRGDRRRVRACLARVPRACLDHDLR